MSDFLMCLSPLMLLLYLGLHMHRAAYGSVFVCVSVCPCISAITVQHLKMKVQLRGFIGIFSWIYIHGFGK